MPNFLTSAQAATRLSLTPATVVLYAKCGRLPAAQIGGQYRFLDSDIDSFFDAHRTTK